MAPVLAIRRAKRAFSLRRRRGRGIRKRDAKSIVQAMWFHFAHLRRRACSNSKHWHWNCPI